MSGRKKRLALFGTWLLALFVLGGLAICQYQYRHSRAVMQQARNSFEKDLASSLLAGSDVNRVLEFLKFHRMTYTDLGEPVYRDARWYQDADKTMEAKGPELKTSVLNCAIHLELKFDKNSKLLGYRDSMPCTGPW